MIATPDQRGALLYWAHPRVGLEIDPTVRRWIVDLALRDDLEMDAADRMLSILKKLAKKARVQQDA